MNPRFPTVALAGMLAATPGHPIAAQAVDSAKARTIETLLTESNAANLLLVNVDAMVAAAHPSSDVPPGFQQAFRQRVQAELAGFLEALAPAYAARFTAEELEQLIAFYRTPVGRRLADEQPELDREATLAGRAWGMRLAAEVLADLAKPVASAPVPTSPAGTCELGVERSLAMSTRFQPRNGGDGYEIWMQNHSNCTLRVTSVFLYECENIRNTCDTSTRRNVDIPPSAERLVLTVLDRDRDARSWFRYRYQWERAP